MRFRSIVSLASIAGALFVTLAAEQANPPAKPAQMTDTATALRVRHRRVRCRSRLLIVVVLLDVGMEHGARTVTNNNALEVWPSRRCCAFVSRSARVAG